MLQYSWKPPRFVRDRSHADNERERAKHHIHIELTDPEDLCPPPIASFHDMKLPPPLITYLKTRNILKPTPIQTQGLPVAFTGRDMIGVAFTGSGKTLTFSLPLLMLAMEEEKRLAYQSGEGPVGLIICPSRELARQTYEGLMQMSDVCAKEGYPRGASTVSMDATIQSDQPTVRTLLAIGGINMADQGHVFRLGVHIVVATPGRLKDLLSKGRITLDLCRYLCLDEADRMIDMGFEEDVRELMSFFKVRWPLAPVRVESR